MLRSFPQMAKPTTFRKEQIWNNELNSMLLEKKNLGYFASKKFCKFFNYNLH